MEASILWYSKMLGFEVLDSKDFSDSGFKQANLKQGNTLLELIELNSALVPSEVIQDYNSKTRLTGFFKIGFRVSDFDKLMDHLLDNDVEIHGNVVRDDHSGKRMVIIKDPDENRIQFFEK